MKHPEAETAMSSSDTGGINNMPNSRGQHSKADRKLIKLQKNQNEHILQLVLEAQQREAARSNKLGFVRSNDERLRLEKSFERERAQEATQIRALQEEHEVVLRVKSEELGVPLGLYSNSPTTNNG